ncbi:MAG: valine--tRNA ligase [Calditrichia bacterium]
MAIELSKNYDPREVEEKWYSVWLDRKYFHAEVNKGKERFVIVIPPPNVTSALHMGHAFNNTIQDILTRYKRKKGFETLWLPGTDHAGIATQNVVERELRKEGKSRHDLGRKVFVERVWDWKEKYGNRIIFQLKKMGCSCDWDRERFTMDEGLSHAVREVFIRLYNKGLIYKGVYIINWCPRCETAISDEEVEHKSSNGHLWYMKYPVKDSDEFVVVATTRPETMLGDTGVAVHPDDERYQHLIGKKVILPLMNREIEVVADYHVDPQFGTGAVKVTPAHDPNDFEIGQRHQLPSVTVMDKTGKMNEHAGDFQGLDRFEARKQIVAELEKQGLLIKIEDHMHNVGHCHRCNTVIEPYLSEQWFVKMKPLAEPALKAVLDGDIKLYPEDRWIKTYKNWMENIRDWCISRQLWWGHRIPVYYCKQCNHMHVAQAMPNTCEKCGSKDLVQDGDVLDTWFSSWLWPFSTLGWPEETEELSYFYPTDVLVTAPDILFFWVARMIMAGIEFMGEVPFKEVFLNGIVRDAQGRKMSKSLGNGIDPVEIIEKYSADAMRFTLIMLSAEGQDINLAESDFEIGRNFSNKLWNASRFLLMNLPDGFEYVDIQEEQLEEIDKWILSKLNRTIEQNEQNMEKFRIQDSLEVVYHFFWHDFCDWYLEMIKSRLYSDEHAESKNIALTVALKVLKETLELLHPYIPFITEEIWQKLPVKDADSIVISEFPSVDSAFNYPQLENLFDEFRSIVSGIRNARAELKIAPSSKIDALFFSDSEEIKQFIHRNKEYLMTLAKLSNFDIQEKREKPKGSFSLVTQQAEIFIPLEGVVDIEKEKERLQKEKERLEGLMKGTQKKLENENFVKKAPEHVVKAEKEKLESLKEKIAKIEMNISGLK